MPENPASYRVVRTKSDLFNKAIQPLKVALIMNGSHSESRPLRRKRRKARSPGLKGITLISSLLIAG
ncbi:hypothetical protein D1Y71_27810 (plasmid) [Klebsiella pneumoniae]|nr:hypothetical protein D1Y71_27810 [Klebsiella pneumoniae]HBX7208583.1 hypothetical protein [Klebsiella pneumoniae]HBX7350433.1 hypothetical protein [Klebsiella pneumoniae]